MRVILWSWNSVIVLHVGVLLLSPDVRPTLECPESF